MEGQVARQPLSTSDAAAAIESLLGDSGELPEAPDVIESDEPEPVEDPEESEEPEESDSQDSDEDEAEEEPEAVSLETLDDVAKALGVDPDDLLANLKMRIKVNGEERLVSLKEAQTGQQLEADYRRKTTELAESRRAAEQEFSQRQAVMQQQAIETAQALNVAEQTLIAELNTPQMQQLRQQNPAEWLMRERDVQSRLGNLHAARQSAAMQWQQQQQMSAAESQRQFQHYLQTEQAELSGNLEKRGVQWTPEERSKLSDFLITRYGFSADDVGQVYNHRLVLLALDAMQNTQKVQESEAKAKQVKEKVAQMPRVTPPGKAQGKVQVQAKVLAGLKGKLKQSGKLKDAAALIERLY
jgi:hypothetical protein